MRALPFLLVSRPAAVCHVFRAVSQRSPAAPVRTLWQAPGPVSRVSPGRRLRARGAGSRLGGAEPYRETLSSLQGRLGHGVPLNSSCFLQHSAADWTLMTPLPPDGFLRCWAPRGRAGTGPSCMWCPWLNPAALLQGLGSLAKFDTSLHLSPYFQHPAEQ